MNSPFRILGAGILFGIVCSISLTLVEAGLNWPDYKGNTGATSVDGSIMSLYSSILLDTGVSTDGKVKNTQKLNSLPLASYQRRVSGTCTTDSPLVQVNANGTVTCRVKASWQLSGGWSSCTAACGGGTQTQSYLCKDTVGTIVADTNCLGAKPADLSRACNAQACACPCLMTYTYVNVTRQWTPIDPMEPYPDASGVWVTTQNPGWCISPMQIVTYGGGGGITGDCSPTPQQWSDFNTCKITNGCM